MFFSPKQGDFYAVAIRRLGGLGQQPYFVQCMGHNMSLIHLLKCLNVSLISGYALEASLDYSNGVY